VGDEDAESTSARIRGIRQCLGLSQVGLAELLRVSNVTISRWEHDRVRPGPAALRRLVQIERDGRGAVLLDEGRRDSREDGLPQFLTVFLRRSIELESIRRNLRDSRLVTLTGPAGCGKTRLAVEAARLVHSSTAIDVSYVSLLALDEPSQVLEAVARALRVRETGRLDVRPNRHIAGEREVTCSWQLRHDCRQRFGVDIQQSHSRAGGSKPGRGRSANSGCGAGDRNPNLASLMVRFRDRTCL